MTWPLTTGIRHCYAYTYSKELLYHGSSNIWLNVTSPCVAVNIRPQASGIFNPSSWQNGWSSAKFVGLLTRTCFFSTVYMFWWGSFQDFRKTINTILDWFINSFTTSDVCLGSLSCWNTQPNPRPNHLLMILGFPEELRDNPPSSLVPCLTVGMVFLI